jgi:DNA helicase-2/ATP-dependent DNA helicase PcrA
VLVLAGAGSGKTRVIVERMAWLVEQRGIDPRNLLALTFTNKAAEEMKVRFARRIGREFTQAWVGTFHAFGLYVLRREMEKIGRPREFTIFDDSDQLSLMKKLVKELPQEFTPVSPREALSWISRLKQEVRGPGPVEKAVSAFDRTCTRLWEQYHAALLRAAAVDFDDLLGLTVLLFETDAEARDHYAGRFRHVLVDEYQDTNRAQYLMARHLSSVHGNIFVVGDEDQSIYSWRGADINNILDFNKDFPAAKTYRLEWNYRSTKSILDAANRVVRNNTQRLGKTLKAVSQEDAPVRFFLAEDAAAEAAFVVGDMKKRGLAPAATAVLYRTHAQARVLEEAFRAAGVHYVVIGGIKFYSRKEIKDVLAYLRLLVNPRDDESLRRIINVPARGIGASTMARFEEYAAARRLPLLQVLREVETDESLPQRARSAAAEFVRLVDDLALASRTEKVEALTQQLLDRTGYRAFVKQSDEKDFRERMEVLEEFIVACRGWDAEGGEGGLMGFLQHLALLTDADTATDTRPAVTLMTCHSAKGLEFDEVYLVGLEEGLLPHASDFRPEEEIEEERRLCYVAMTRARKGLTLCTARSRMVYGQTDEERRVSRFIEEIGEERLDRIGKKKAAGAAGRTAGGLDANAIRTGVRVRHATFGTGYVMFTTGSGDQMKARIRFKTGRVAMLMVAKAPLEILEG